MLRMDSLHCSFDLKAAPTIMEIHEFHEEWHMSMRKLFTVTYISLLYDGLTG